MKAHPTPLYDIYDIHGRRMYIGLRDAGDCYDWPNSNGFVDKLQMRREHWTARLRVRQP